MFLILLATVSFPTFPHFSLCNSFAPAEQHVDANKGEKQEMTTNPGKPNDDHLGYFSLLEQSEDNFKSQKPLVRLEMLIHTSSCFPFSLEFTVPRFFCQGVFQNVAATRRTNEQMLRGADVQLGTNCWRCVQVL